MKKRLITLICILAVAVTFLHAKDYNVRDYGAVGDGKTLDHTAINAAIDTCVAHGGGHTYFKNTPVCSQMTVSLCCTSYLKSSPFIFFTFLCAHP